MQRMQRFFIKNIKERKEHNILFIKNAKERENAHSFEKNGCPTLQWVYPIGTCSAFFYIYLPDLICTVYLYCIYFPVHILVHWKFSVYLWEIFIAQTYDWKFSVYLWEIFIAQKYELENKYKYSRRYILIPANRCKRKCL